MTGACVICGLEGPTGRGLDGHQQDCRRCGPYVITGSARAMIGSRLEDDDLAWARASHAIRQLTSYDHWLTVGSNLVDDLTMARLPTPDVQLRNLLERIARRAGEDAFAHVNIDADDLAGFVGVADGANLDALVEHAIGDGLLARRLDGRLSLTHGGWRLIQPSLEPTRAAEATSPTVRPRPAWLDTLADETARSLADEVHLALAAGVPTLAAMGVRALLDRTFELAGADAGADFGTKLRQLRDAGTLGEGELETMRVVTDAGSAAGHRGWRPEPEQLDTILDAAEAFLHRIAVQPGQTERLRGAVPPRPGRRRSG